MTISSSRQTANGEPPAWLVFFERTYPSANSILIRGREPVLVDTGFGSDALRTEQLLAEAGARPKDLSLVVNTHYHSDHVGGNAAIQHNAGVPVAAHRWEADLVNRRDVHACAGDWLDQPVEPYSVDVPLSDGDVIQVGSVALQVLHTPGHTLGHISLFEPESGTLICGDALHGGDVGWINPFREGVSALRQAIESVERLASLPVRWACSGHGPAFADPQETFAAARLRYLRWLAEPERMAWHACRRIFAYALMIVGGIPEADVTMYLEQRKWVQDYARDVFGIPVDGFARQLLSEMLRSGAARREGPAVVATTHHISPPPGWERGPVHPALWPARPNGSRQQSNLVKGQP